MAQHPGPLNLLEARQWVAEAAETSPTQSRYITRALRAYAKFLSEEYREPNALERLKLYRDPEPDPQRVQPATRDHLDAMLKVCDENTTEGLRDAAIIRLMLSSGMRCSEVARLELRDVDHETRVVIVREPKNDVPRRTRMDEDTSRAIRKYRRRLGNVGAPQSKVFESFNGSGWVSANSVSRMFGRRADQAGIPAITAHGLRRGFAVEQLRRGMAETHLMQLAGWRSPAMVAKYTKAVAADEALAAYDRLRA